MARVFRMASGDAMDFLEGAVCALGVFDGVHEGHATLIEEAARNAAKLGVPCVVITFDIDPDELFAHDTLKKIMSNEARISYLSSLPIDYVLVLDFTPEFASLSPDEFLQSVFDNRLPASIYVGEDFRFGRAAGGNVEDLSEWGRRCGVAVVASKLVESGGEPVKATRIRRLLVEGKLDEAHALLGHPYFVVSKVKHGRGEGHEMGFATANLNIPDEEKLLSDGVYSGYAYVDEKRYKAAISMGTSPTFEDEAASNVEVHILDFEGDLYGKDIKVEFVERLRPMKKFDHVSELIATVNRDIEHVRNTL